MSGQPTRGMVAGGPIQTQANNEDFERGYERIFGKDRKPARGRYVVREGQVVAVGSDWTDAPRLAQTPTEELTYARLKATDGTDISTRKKHRDYLKQNGLAQSSDFSKEWYAKEEASKDRALTKEYREHTERALDTLIKRGFDGH